MPDVPDPQEYFFNQPWSDGLPVIVPTRDRLERMLRATRRPPEEVIGPVPPAGHPATVESLALHALMAGCRPEYLPVVLGAVEALLDPRLNINGLQGTMNPGGPLLILNGPYARKIGAHAGSGCFGPGFRANATIGRALRLVLLNLGGGIPGVVDMSTFGGPSKFTYCVREHEEISPWPTLAEDRGFSREDDVLTVCPAENPRAAMDHASAEPDGLLATIASTMSTMGTRNCYSRCPITIAVGPDHAAILARAGLSRGDIQQELHERARLPVGLLKRGGRYSGPGRTDWPEWVDHEDDDCLVPVVQDPGDIILFVAGGVPGPSTFVIPGWNPSSWPVSLRYRTD